MMEEDKLKDFLTGIGAMGESLFIFYRSLKNAGFEDGQAMALTIAFMSKMLDSLHEKGGAE